MDSFDLARFVNAQTDEWANIVAELRAGRKQSHWIWYVFPQLKGMGFSANSNYYGLSGLTEARAYLAHRVLGARLLEAVGLVNATKDKQIAAILGDVDAMKLRSSMTLFAEAADDPAPFREALERHFAGEADERTLRMLAS